MTDPMDELAGVSTPLTEEEREQFFLTVLGRPRFTWGRVNPADVGETRKPCVFALRAADNQDYNPLLKFVRS